MRLKLKSALVVCGLLLLTLVVNGQRPTLGRAPLTPPAPPKTPLKAIGAIFVPPFLSSIDIYWVDEARGKLYIADRTNNGIDVIDLKTEKFVMTIGGFISTAGVGGGPNGVVVTPDNILFAGDASSTLQVVDLNANPPAIVKSNLIGASTDGRADELAYDPEDKIIMIGNDASVPPRVTFFSAVAPYAQLGQIKFPDATGMEQPVYSVLLHKFIQNVPAAPIAYEAVIDPKTFTVTKTYPIADCPSSAGLGVNGLILAPFQRLLVGACLNVYVMNEADGTIITKIANVNSGDEMTYNAFDGQYYLVPSNSSPINRVLLQVDATTNVLQQSLSVPTGLRNVASYAGNGHVYSVAARPAVGTVDATPCAAFSVIGTGCVAVFGH